MIKRIVEFRSRKQRAKKFKMYDLNAPSGAGRELKVISVNK